MMLLSTSSTTSSSLPTNLLKDLSKNQMVQLLPSFLAFKTFNALQEQGMSRTKEFFVSDCLEAVQYTFYGVSYLLSTAISGPNDNAFLLFTWENLNTQGIF